MYAIWIRNRYRRMFKSHSLNIDPAHSEIRRAGGHMNRIKSSALNKASTDRTGHVRYWFHEVSAHVQAHSQTSIPCRRVCDVPVACWPENRAVRLIKQELTARGMCAIGFTRGFGACPSAPSNIDSAQTELHRSGGLLTEYRAVRLKHKATLTARGMCAICFTKCIGVWPSAPSKHRFPAD